MGSVSVFSKLHVGKTVLLVGNGANLISTPPEAFPFISFGMNTSHLWKGDWIPNYYVAVDQRVMREFGDDVVGKFCDIPKFVPRPNLNKWQGENFYRFLHRPGLPKPKKDALGEEGISYTNVMHVALQVAWYMGFKTVLMVGVEHRPFKAQNHFWGCDHGMTANPPLDIWFKGYSEIVEAMSKDGVQVLNISEVTYLPDDVIARGDWKEWSKK